jgi:hypothetical protein
MSNNVYLPTVATGFRPVRPAPLENPKKQPQIPGDIAERIRDYLEFSAKDRNHDGVLTPKEYRTPVRTPLAGGTEGKGQPSLEEIRNRIQKAISEVGTRVWLR